MIILPLKVNANDALPVLSLTKSRMIREGIDGPISICLDDMYMVNGGRCRDITRAAIRKAMGK